MADYMLIFLNERDREVPDSVYQEMGKFAGELAAQGKMKGGQPLHPERQGARVRVQGGEALTTDGPFTETKEIIGGFFIVDCESRDEAIELARRCPHSRYGITEVLQVLPVGR